MVLGSSNNIVLVDYENLIRSDKTKGVEFIIEKILSKLERSFIKEQNINIRFYGGWFELDHLTTSAIELMVDINNLCPPLLKTLSDGSHVLVRVEIAKSLLAAPAKTLFHTFRKRPMPSGLVCEDPHLNPACKKTQCPAKIMHQFLKNGKCNECEDLKPKDILSKSEQKLVDAMLISDLLYLANSLEQLIIVSSDDDIWPGILTALSMNIHIIHLHTKENKQTNLFYSQTATSKYIEKNINI